MDVFALNPSLGFTILVVIVWLAVSAYAVFRQLPFLFQGAGTTAALFGLWAISTASVSLERDRNWLSSVSNQLQINENLAQTVETSLFMAELHSGLAQAVVDLKKEINGIKNDGDILDLGLFVAIEAYSQLNDEMMKQLSARLIKLNADNTNDRRKLESLQAVKDVGGERLQLVNFILTVLAAIQGGLGHLLFGNKSKKATK